MAGDGEVEPGPRPDQHALADRPQEPQEHGVGEQVEARVTCVGGRDQPARPRGGGPPESPERCRPQVGEHAEADAGVQLEAALLGQAVHAHHLHVVVAGELARDHEGRAHRAADRERIGDEEADHHEALRRELTRTAVRSARTVAASSFSAALPSTVIAALTRLPRPIVLLLVAVKRAWLRVIRAGLLRYVRAAPSPGGDPGRKVYILLVSAWGMGGTIRAAINLAGYLADRYEVEIISTYRRNDEPYFAFDPRVKVVALDDQRKGVRQPRLRKLLNRFSSALYHPADIRKHNHTLWTDIQLVRHLRRAEGIAIASRPGQIMQLADLAAAGADHGRARADEPALALEDPAQGDAPPLRQARRPRRAHRAGPRRIRERPRRFSAADLAAAEHGARDRAAARRPRRHADLRRRPLHAPEGLRLPDPAHGRPSPASTRTGS